MDQFRPDAMRHFLLPALLFLSIPIFAQFPAPYCGVTYQYNSDGNMITRVQFAGIDQTSPANSGSTPSMENFLSVTGQVTAGQTYPVSVKGPSSTFPSDVVLFVDWNQNQRFDDPGESYYVGRLEAANPANAFAVNATVTVPGNALPGITRMRLLKNTNLAAYSDPAAPNGVTDACSATMRSGQMEDYSLQVTGGQPANTCTPAEAGPNPGDRGCVSFSYRGQTVYYPTVRAADGNIWLEKNLGAQQVAIAKDDSLSYGHLFQWGRWDDGHQLRNSATAATPATGNPSGIGTGSSSFFVGTSSAAWWNANALTDTWKAATAAGASATNGVDPCKAIGPGWSLPTQEQWVQVIADEGFQGPDQAFASHLKLPVGGTRSSSDGTFTFVGVRGYYWSATTGNTGGRFLYYSAAITNPNSGGPRGSGSSVRCLSAAPAPVTVDSVAVRIRNNAAPRIVGIGNTLQAEATVYPAGVSQSVTWSIVPGTGTASVNGTGLVTAQSEGTVWVKAVSVLDPAKRDSLPLNLYAACVPTVNLDVQPGNRVCPGTPVTFTAQTTHAGSAPVYVWKKNGNTLGATGATYTETAPQTGDVIVCRLTSDAVCNLSGAVTSDSITLQVNPTLQTTLTENICRGESFSFYGSTLTTAGSYTHTLNSAAGCDSILTLQLTVTAAPAPVVQLIGNLLSTGNFTTYQWLLNGQPAPGNATSQTYLPGPSGQYSVRVANAAGCTATSAAYTHQNTMGIDEATWDGLSVYPNPAENFLTVRLPQSVETVSIALYTTDGRALRHAGIIAGGQYQLDVHELKTGLYLLQIRTADGNQKTVRVIKK